MYSTKYWAYQKSNKTINNHWTNQQFTNRNPSNFDKNERKNYAKTILNIYNFLHLWFQALCAQFTFNWTLLSLHKWLIIIFCIKFRSKYGINWILTSCVNQHVPFDSRDSVQLIKFRMLYPIHSGNYREENKDLRVYASTYSMIYPMYNVYNACVCMAFRCEDANCFEFRMCEEEKKESNQRNNYCYE